MVIILEDFKTYSGRRIKEYRESKHFTQEYMAKELDIAPNHYGRIERGENACTLSKLIQICNILEITPNDVLASLIITKENSLETEVQKLSLNDKEIVLKFVEYLISKY